LRWAQSGHGVVLQGSTANFVSYPSITLHYIPLQLSSHSHYTNVGNLLWEELWEWQTLLGKNELKMSKVPLFPLYCCSGSKCKNKIFPLVNILILSSHIHIFYSKYLFEIFCFNSFCLPENRQFHSGFDQLHSVSLVILWDAVSPGNLLSTFRYKLGKQTSCSEILLLMSTQIWEKYFATKRRVPITKWHGVVKQVTEGQKETNLLREGKNCKMQDITFFCH
jgi:hypothetical protein